MSPLPTRSAVGLDGADWERLVRAEGPRLLRIARAYSRDEASAEDLVQEAFVRAYRSRATYRGDATPATWLTRILRNLAIDRSRSSHREVLMDDVEANWRNDAYTIDPEVVLVRAESAGELLDALTRLSHAYRSVVVLHDVEGWTVAEIAAALEIDLPAAKQRLRRGRMALVTALSTGHERRVALKGVPMNCWEARRQVSDYLDGLLDEAARERIHAHLGTCPTCPPLVAALTGATTTLGSLRRDPDNVLDPVLARRIRSAMEADPG